MDDKFVYPCDLHGHTNRSDGNDTPAEFIEYAAARGVKIAAITDHDIVPPQTVVVDNEEIEISSFAKSKGVQLIKGIEISCETQIEDVHLICFGCNWKDTFFKELDRFTVLSKVKSYQKLTERLTELGMCINWQEVLENNENVPEERIQKKMIFEVMASKGYAENWGEAKLMVKKDSRICIKREKPDAVDVIQNVHRMGGVVILAHPYLIEDEIEYQGKRISRSDFIEVLIEAGLDGIEACYTYDKTSYGGSLSKKEIYDEVIEEYGRRIRIISGGSDYHGDRKKGVQNPRELGECGITEEEFYENPHLKALSL